MKKLFFVMLTGLSLNAFAGGSGWNPDEVDPARCVMAVGSGPTSAGRIQYNMNMPICAQGINEGVVKGVNVKGHHEFNDGTTDTFSGSVTPSSPLRLDTDTDKVNKVGVKRWWYDANWIK